MATRSTPGEGMGQHQQFAPGMRLEIRLQASALHRRTFCYVAPWKSCRQADFDPTLWDSRDWLLEQDFFANLSPNWQRHYPLCSDYICRQLKVETNILDIQPLGMPLDGIKAIDHVPLFLGHQCETENWDDARGHIVSFHGMGFVGLDLPRRAKHRSLENDTHNSTESQKHIFHNTTFGWKCIRGLQKGVARNTNFEKTHPNSSWKKAVKNHAPASIRTGKRSTKKHRDFEQKNILPTRQLAITGVEKLAYKGTTMGLNKTLITISLTSLMAGCTYHSTAPISASYNVYSNYGEKIPGRYALHIEGDEFSGSFKAQGYNCSFHTFTQDAGGAFSQSVIQTFENLVDYIEPVEHPLDRNDIVMRGLDGQIVVKAENMDARIRVIPGFWNAEIEVDIDLAANMTVDSMNERLLGTSVSGDGDAITSAGSACGGGAEAMSLATSDALEELMQRLGERLSNSPRVRHQ